MTKEELWEEYSEYEKYFETRCMSEADFYKALDEYIRNNKVDKLKIELADSIIENIRYNSDDNFIISQSKRKDKKTLELIQQIKELETANG